MISKDIQILQCFGERIRNHFPDAKIIAFGSRARGESSWDSDFDVCIVIEDVTAKDKDVIREISWQTGFENDCVITTAIFSTFSFEKGPMSESTLIHNIHREGIAA